MRGVGGFGVQVADALPPGRLSFTHRLARRSVVDGSVDGSVGAHSSLASGFRGIEAQ